MRGRELKHRALGGGRQQGPSPAMRGRELKLLTPAAYADLLVARHARA